MRMATAHGSAAAAGVSGRLHAPSARTGRRHVQSSSAGAWSAEADTHTPSHTHARSATFRAYLGSGDKDQIFAILKWVVPQPQELQKRAFVGHYLSFPDVSGGRSGVCTQAAACYGQCVGCSTVCA
jgi:hypothetical protein